MSECFFGKVNGLGFGFGREMLTSQPRSICTASEKLKLYKADGVAAALLRVIIPLTAADGDAVVRGQALFMPGAEQTLTPAFEKNFEINRHSLRFLSFGKGNKVCYWILPPI